MNIYMADDIVVTVSTSDPLMNNMNLSEYISEHPDRLLEHDLVSLIFTIPHQEFGHRLHLFLLGGDGSFINAIFKEVIPMEIKGDTYNSQTVLLETIRTL